MGILFSCTLFVVKAKVSQGRNSVLIYIDPGHGGFDGGCTDKTKMVLEKNITLKMSLLLTSYLRRSGYMVKLTREKDQALGKTKKEDIYKRVEKINSSHAKLYISIHANSFPSDKVHGAQVFYGVGQLENKNLALSIMNLIKCVDSTNKRTIEPLRDKYLVDHVTIPGCLIEVGFLSNAYDLENLLNDIYIQNLTQMIYLGIMEYIDNLK